MKKMYFHSAMIALTIHRFQWVALQIDQLHKLSRERDIKNRLGKLPRTLEEAYDEIYTRIHSEEGSASEVARRAFQWIMCSKKPISPAMLVTVVCQDPTTDNVDVVDLKFEFVLESCQNLLKVEIAEEDEFCRFSHLSVQEYLEKNHFSPLSNNVLVAQVCLTFLTDPIPSGIMLKLAGESSESSSSIDTDKTSDEQNDKSEESTESDEINGSEEFSGSEEVQEEGLDEVRKYARTFWLIHVQRSYEIEGDFDSRLIVLLKRFLGSGAETTPAFQKWARSSEGNVIYSMHSRFSRARRLDPPSQLAVQIAGFGLHRMLKDSWEHVDPHQKNAEDKPLLAIAAEAGNASTVQSLLDKGAEIDASSIKCASALCYASSEGRKSVVEVLLGNGADVNITGKYRGSPLQAASKNGHESVARLLLRHGADVNTQGGVYHTALQAASGEGHKSIVGLLLDHGASVNAQGEYYHTSLQAASGKGHESVARLLLRHGADVNAQGGCYHTALQAASVNRHESIVGLLLDRGADVNAQGGYYGNALDVTSREGFAGVVTMLLEHGALDQDSKALTSACQHSIRKYYRKPPEEAKAIVILLLKAGAVDREGHALKLATENGFEEAANLLREAAERNGSRISENAEGLSNENV